MASKLETKPNFLSILSTRSTVFPRIVPADTINLSHRNNPDTIWGRILFNGGHYYFHARDDTVAGAKWWSTNVCERQLWTTSWLSLFPTRAGISPLVYVYQPPPSSRASPLALLTRGHKYLSGRVRILIEGGYYFIQHKQSCGYYSRADTIRRAGTIRGNTVYVSWIHWNCCTLLAMWVGLHKWRQ